MENEARYLFNGISITHSIPEIGNAEKLYLKGQVHLGDVLIDFRLPISRKSFEMHEGQQLALLTQELLRRAIQEESLKEWLESQSES